VRGGFLHVAQGHAGVERGGDECVPEGVRDDVLGDPGAAGDPGDDAGGAVPVQTPRACGDKERSFSALADGQVDGARCAARAGW
jgi:hypothetical protein